MKWYKIIAYINFFFFLVKDFTLQTKCLEITAKCPNADTHHTVKSAT